MLGQRLEGQKQILQFLGWTRWEKVARLRAQGLPVGKVGGRWTAWSDQLIDWLRRETVARRKDA